MTTTPNPPNENSDGPDVNDVLNPDEDTANNAEKDLPDDDESDRDVSSGLSEA